MRIQGIALLATFVLHANPSWAECSAATLRQDLQLSPDALKVRAGIFMSLCAKSSPELVDADDAALQERIIKPKPDFTKTKPPPFLYPDEAIEKGIQGKAMLVALIEADGHVSQLALVQSAGNKALDKAAAGYMVVVRQWHPGLLDGVPTPMLVTIPFDFSIKDTFSGEELPSPSAPGRIRRQP